MRTVSILFRQNDTAIIDDSIEQEEVLASDVKVIMSLRDDTTKITTLGALVESWLIEHDE